MADFLRECLADPALRAMAQTDNEATFREMVCLRCRQPGCDLAGWAGDRFARRVSEQPDRMFQAEQRDPSLPRYAHLVDFKDMLHRAMQLEVADRRGDWEVPEIPIVDGRVDKASPATSTAVDNAVRAMAHAQGREAPDLPDPHAAADEAFVTETADLMGQVVEPEEPTPPPEDPPDSKPMRQAPQVSRPQMPNTQIPAGGLMVDGATTEPQRAADPWAPPKPKPDVVPVGAKIRMALSGPPEVPDET